MSCEARRTVAWETDEAEIDDHFEGEAEESRPTAIDPRKHLHYVKISEEGLVATFVGRGEYTDVGAVQANYPFPRRSPIAYYEVKILEGPPMRAAICVGLAPSSALLNRPPGGEARSVGYRGEDGFQQSRPGGGEGSTFEAFGPAFGRGDVVGCGVVNSSRGVFFTKNGVFLGNAGRVEPLANLYPTVSLKHNGDAIRVNFRGPFLFNLRLLFHRQLMEERQMIRQEHLNPDTLLSLVRSYLLHSGFEKTLKAFNETVGKPKQRKRKTDEGDNNASPNNHSISPNASSSNGSNSSSNSSFNNVSSNISGSNGEEQDRDMENEKETTETNETNGEETGTPQLASADSNTEDEGDKEDREAVLVVWPPAVPQRLSRSLAQRASVVQAIMDGRISEAIHLLKAHFPLVLAPSHDDACSLARVLLLSQEVVEALRPPKKDLKTAIMCIRRNIAPLMKEVSPMLRKVASECLGVLAYEDPATSPSSHVFHLSRRSLTASAVNRTILKKHLHVTVWSPLEVLVRHLVACRQVLRTLGGSRGPVPSSREYSHPLPLRQTIEALEAELL